MSVCGVVSVYEDAGLLPHFLRHYRSLGVDRMLLLAKSEGAEAAVLEGVATAGFGEYVKVSSGTSVGDKDDAEDRALAAAGVARDDWVMHLDLDEFHQYPAPLREVMGGMGRAVALRGRMVDRVAADGRLRPVTPSPSVFDQFPVVADVTGGLLRAAVAKVMLCRRWVRLIGGRHGTLDRARYGGTPVAGVCIVHHFKWVEGADARLAARLSDRGVSRTYHAQCRRFLAHYRRLGRIDLTDPRIRAHVPGRAP